MLLVVKEYRLIFIKLIYISKLVIYTYVITNIYVYILIQNGLKAKRKLTKINETWREESRKYYIIHPTTGINMIYPSSMYIQHHK